MLIRSKLFRAGGTRVELGKGKEARRYHFKPLSPGAKLDDNEVEHVCDVTNAEDIGTLLAIREGYEVHASEVGSKAKAAVKEAVSPPAPPAPPAAPKGQKPYASLNKPELIKLIAEKTGKQPHGSTARSKLIEQLEALDKQAV